MCVCVSACVRGCVCVSAQGVDIHPNSAADVAIKAAEGMDGYAAVEHMLSHFRSLFRTAEAEGDGEEEEAANNEEEGADSAEPRPSSRGKLLRVAAATQWRVYLLRALREYSDGKHRHSPFSLSLSFSLNASCMTI